MAPKELKPPPLVHKDPDALELLRCWAAHEELHVTLSWDVWEDPADWGVLLVDLARHIASAFEQERGAGNNILDIKGLSKSRDGQVMFKDLTFTVERGDKIAFAGTNDLAKTTLMQVLMGETDADSGTFKWGVSTSQAYYP